MRTFSLDANTSTQPLTRHFAFACSQLVLQSALVWATDYLLIWNIHTREVLAVAAAFVPFLATPILKRIGIVCIFHRLKVSLWSRTFSTYSIITYIFATCASLFHLTVSMAVRRADIASNEIIAINEIKVVLDQIDEFAAEHSNLFPDTLESLSPDHWFATNHSFQPTSRIIEKPQSHGAQVDLKKFEYYGAGLRLVFGPPAVPVLSSREMFYNGDRLMVLKDGRVLWIQSKEFEAIHQELVSHLWVYNESDTSIRQAVAGIIPLK